MKLFIASEYSFDVEHPAAVPLAQGLIKNRIECARKLREISERGEIKCLSIAVGGFLDEGLINGFLGFHILSRKATLYDNGKHKTTGSTLPFIGRVVLQALQATFDGPNYQRLRVPEVEYTGQGVLALLEKHTNSTFETENVSTDELKRRGDEALDACQLRAGYVNYVVKLNYDGSGAAYFPEGLDMWREELGRQSLDSIVQQAVQRLTRAR